MIIGTRIKLRDKSLGDIQNDYTWSMDGELLQLDAAPLLPISFHQYLSDCTEELSYPSASRYRFAVETLDGKHIGNCSYYNIIPEKDEAELGIMIGNRDYWNKGYGVDVVNSLVNHIFHQTKLRRVYLKTLDWNTRAHKCFHKCGFVPYGQLARDGYNFVLMELHRNQWEKHQKKQCQNESSAAQPQ